MGKDGFLSVEDSTSTTTDKERVSGLLVDKGFVSPYLINTEKGTAELRSPNIILVNKKIESFQEIVPLISLSVQAGNKNIVIVADGFSEDTLRAIVLNRLNGNISPLLVEIPGFGSQKLESLRDISAVVGAKVIDPAGGDELEKPVADWYGSAELVRSKKDETTFLNGKGAKKNVDARVKELQQESEGVHTAMEKERLAKRIAQLTGGIGVIRVGATTEQEQKTKRAKVEDAVNATKAAFKGGLSLGGGKTFAELKTSSDVLNEALQAPRKLLETNGAEFLDDTVYDPTDVLIAALETAVSTAIGLVSMSGIVAPKHEEKEHQY
jgi:chaperonin GroEL